MQRNWNLNSSNLFLVSDLKTLRRGGSVLCSNSPPKSNANLNGAKVTSLDVHGFARDELVIGKTGSVSFHGLTHQLVEESKPESAPFKEGTSSFSWVLDPAALVSALVLPQFFITNTIQAVVGDVVLAAVCGVQHKKGGVYHGPHRIVTWPIVGLQGLVAVVPFLVGCVVQQLFETFLDCRSSSSWPLVPIIFKIYRLYQLTKAAHFTQMLIVMTSTNGAAVSPQVFDRAGALVSMMVAFQVLGVVCLWSLMTF